MIIGWYDVHDNKMIWCLPTRGTYRVHMGALVDICTYAIWSLDSQIYSWDRRCNPTSRLNVFLRKPPTRLKHTQFRWDCIVDLGHRFMNRGARSRMYIYPPKLPCTPDMLPPTSTSNIPSDWNHLHWSIQYRYLQRHSIISDFQHLIENQRFRW